MAEVDWTNDEAVVRAYRDTVQPIRSEIGGWFISMGVYDGKELGYSAYEDVREAWKVARQHPSVQAWEKANRPAEVETHEK